MLSLSSKRHLRSFESKYDKQLDNTMLSKFPLKPVLFLCVSGMWYKLLRNWNFLVYDFFVWLVGLLGFFKLISRTNLFVANLCRRFSENHKIVSAGRDLLRSPSPISLFNQCQYSKFLRSHSVGFWIFPRMDTQQPLWATCSTDWPPSQEMFNWKFLHLNLSLVPLVLLLDTTKERPSWSSASCY